MAILWDILVGGGDPTANGHLSRKISVLANWPFFLSIGLASSRRAEEKRCYRQIVVIVLLNTNLPLNTHQLVIWTPTGEWIFDFGQLAIFSLTSTRRVVEKSCRRKVVPIVLLNINLPLIIRQCVIWAATKTRPMDIFLKNRDSKFAVLHSHLVLSAS